MYKEKVTVVVDWLNMAFPNTKPNRTTGYQFYWHPTSGLEQNQISPNRLEGTANGQWV